MEPHDKPSLIRLDNGETIVAIIISESEQTLTVTFPLELVRFPIGPNMETTSIRPWATWTDDKEFHIRQNKIISISNLKEEYVDGYLKILWNETNPDLLEESEFDKGWEEDEEIERWLEEHGTDEKVILH